VFTFSTGQGFPKSLPQGLWIPDLRQEAHPGMTNPV
jgi:hypothetical protein